MKFQLITPIDMKQMPWKNGGGVTSEVAIFPSLAEVGKLDFDWRVSIATVASNGPFSLFPGYDRQLVVWQGEGLLINGVERRGMEPFEFSGDQGIEASLIGGPVRDFGIIFRRGRVRSAMEVYSLRQGDVAKVDVDGEGFVLCAEGELRIDELGVSAGDVVRATGSGEVLVVAEGASRFVAVRVARA